MELIYDLYFYMIEYIYYLVFLRVFNYILYINDVFRMNYLDKNKLNDMRYFRGILFLESL